MAERIEGLSIGLDLDSMGLDRSLKDIKRSFKDLGSSIKVDMNNLKYGEKNVDSYKKSIDKLDDSLKKQRKNLSDLKLKYDEAVKAQGENSKEARILAAQYNKQADSLNMLERQMSQATNELKELQEQQRIASSRWTKFADGAEQAGDRLTNIGSGLKSMGQSMSMYITAPLAGLGIAATKTAMEFEAQMSRVGAIAGATSEEMDQLKEAALELGASTSKSASEVAVGMEKMAASGYNTNQILAAMPGIIAAAEASGEDMALVTDVVSSALNSFGLEASEATHVADVLAQAANQSSADINDLGYSFSYAAPVAKGLGISLEELAAATGIMADAGIKGERAGTSLRSALLRLSDPPKEARDALNGLGISVLDSKKQMKPFSQIIGEVKKATDGMTDAQKMATLSQLFGTEAVSGMLSVVNAGPEKLNKLTKGLENSGGAAEEAAERMKDNLKGAIEELGGSFETAAIKVGEILTPTIKSLAGIVQGLTEKFINMSPAGQKMSIVFAAIAAAIGPLLVVAGILISSLGSIAKAFGPVARSIAKAGGLLKWLRLGLTALTGPIGLTIGIISALAIGFITLYKKSDTFRGMVGKLTDKLKELAGKALEGLKTAVSAVVDFFKEQLKVLQNFWKQNSTSITGALENIGKVVSVVFGAIVKVIQFAMPLVLGIIKSVWGNIKGVIKGALKVIMGTIQIFSGLLTGDFKKMWTGIKNVFKGALQFIWNFVQLMFWGKMLKGIMSLGKLLLGVFKNMWGGIKNIFSVVIKAIVDFVKNRFTSMKNGITSIFTGIRNFASKIWSSIKSGIVNPIKGAVDYAKTKFTGFKNSTVELFGNIKKSVTGYVSDMISAVKGMPGKMKDGLVKMGYKVKEGVISIANKMASGLGKGVNGVITGVNWVTDKLGIKSKIKKWDVPQYAQGTDGHSGGLALVGDGKGRNAGRELIQTPDGQTMLSPAKDTLLNLPKGTQVLSALDTKALLGNVPKYAKGTGGMIQSGLKKAKDFALNIWDYATKPSKLLNLALDKLGIKAPDSSNLIGKIAKGGFNFVKSKAVEYVKKMFAKTEAEGGNLTKPNFGGRFRYTSGFGPRWGRLHGGVDYAAPVGTPIPSQSGGRVSFASHGWNGGFGNLVKVKQGMYEHFYAHMSRVLTRVGQRVSKGSILGLVGSTGDSTGPHVHYELRKNGMRLNPGKPGFATGGLINKAGLYPIAEEGHGEWIIPRDPKRRTDAMKLLALAGKDISGNKRPNQLPSPTGGGRNEEISLLRQQVQLLTELVLSSRNIENKPVLSEGDIGRATAKYEARNNSKHNIYTGRPAY